MSKMNYTTHEGPIDGSKVEYREVLIDLDCLLDTRIALIAQRNQDKAVEILLGDSYRKRKRDHEFFNPYLKEGEVWSEVWKHRHEPILDNTISMTLSMSDQTRILEHIYAYVHEETLVQNDQPTTLEDIRITVNVYPYYLNDRELKSMSDIVAEAFPHVKMTKVVSIPTERLDPAHIRRYYDSYWLYDLTHWFLTHKSSFENTLHPNTRIFAPKLIRDEGLDKEKMTEHAIETASSETFFEEFEGIMSLWMDLRLIDIEYYCVPDVEITRRKIDDAIAEALRVAESKMSEENKE